LLPDFLHVNFFPLTTSVAPALEHFAPALAAAKDEGGLMSVRAAIKRPTRDLRIGRGYNRNVVMASRGHFVRVCNYSLKTIINGYLPQLPSYKDRELGL